MKTTFQYPLSLSLSLNLSCSLTDTRKPDVVVIANEKERKVELDEGRERQIERYAVTSGRKM